MKTILTTLLSAALSGAAFAQVPSLINYQGRLTDATGEPVTGSKTFAISIYDAATGGTLLYTESIGAVTLDSNGVYSFQFGNAGTSNTQVTETIGTANGTLTTFQKVLANSPVVAGTVSVTDGTYTWTQSAGSSNEDDFGVAYSNSLRRVTANYYAGAPTSGKTITATYRYGTSGISGALSSGAEHWMAVSVDSVVQGTRQRVLAVPFALQAEVSKQLAPEFKFGNYDSRQPNTTYQAEQSGFVIASYPGGGSSSSVRQVLVGDDPNNLVGITPTNAGNSMSGVQHCVPVSKGRFWHAQGFTEVKFVAISQ
ncbi:MAG: hypothetical protein ORN51_14365 [Akkermansiaceae bacterium]|nr:hypothetical protein [Akkermansiaceae bacterium]